MNFFGLILFNLKYSFISRLITIQRDKFMFPSPTNQIMTQKQTKQEENYKIFFIK